MTVRRGLSLLAIVPALALLAACNRPSAPAEVEPMEPPAVDDPAPTSPPSSSDDACLDGQWWSYTHDIDILLATLAPVPNMHVSNGDLVLWFNPDGQYEYQGRVVLRLDMDPSEDQYMETTGFFTTSGPYSTDGEATLNLDLSNSRTEILEVQACKNGTCIAASGGMPSVSIMPPGSAPYRCTADRLEIDTQGPFGTATMFFYR